MHVFMCEVPLLPTSGLKERVSWVPMSGTGKLEKRPKNASWMFFVMSAWFGGGADLGFRVQG